MLWDCKEKLYMIKKISLILIFAIVLGFNTPRSFANVNSVQTQNDAKLAISSMVYIGVLDDTLSDTQAATLVKRSDSAVYLARFLKVDVASYTESHFADTENCAAADILAAMGIFNGDGDGMFYPDRVISVSEALAALTRTVSNKYQFENMTKYVLKAKQLKLSSSSGLYGELTMSDLAVLLFNLGQCEPETFLSIGNRSYEFALGSTFFETLYDLHYINGHVTESSYTTLRSTKLPTLNKNHIIVDGVELAGTQQQAMEYIGRYVDVVYEKRKSDSVAKIVYIASDESENDELTVNGDDIISFDGNIFKYYKDGVEKKLSLSSDLSVLYNGKAAEGVYENLFSNIKIGSVTFIRGDSGKYSVAEIEDIKNVTVKMTDHDKYIIYTDGSGVISSMDFSENSDSQVYRKIYSSYGKSLGATSLIPGDKISVAASEDASVIKVIKNTKTVTGTVENISGTQSMQKTARISGNDYPVADELELKLGEGGTFILDCKGTITWQESSDVSERVGYIYEVKQFERSFTKQYGMKIFTIDGQFVNLYLKEKVKVDGNKISDEETYYTFTNKGVAIRQLVVFDTNSKGEIVAINTAQGVESGYGVDKLTSVTDGVKELFHFKSTMTFMPIYTMAYDTKVIIVPPTSAQNYSTDNFAVVTYGNGDNVFPEEINYNVELFKIGDARPYIDYVVYEMELSPAMGKYPPSVLVDSISTVSIDGAKYTKISGYSEYNPITIYADDNVNLAMVEEGDIINYAMNAGGNISSVRVLYDLSENKTFWDSLNAYRYETLFRFGDIKSIETDKLSEKQAKITISFNGEDADYIVMDKNQFKFMVYDTAARKNKVYVGSIEDAAAAVQNGKMLVVGSLVKYLQFFLYK